MTDFLDEKRFEIAARLSELEPLVEEYERLSAAAAALGGIGGPSTAPAVGSPRAGRRGGSGTRAGQVLAIVQEQPGITIPELAIAMGIRQNYLYRVLPALEREGEVRRVMAGDARRTAGREPSGWVPQREEWCNLCRETHRLGKHRK